MIRTLLVIALAVLSLNAQAFRVYTEHNPPFNYENKHTIEGSSTKLLKTLFSLSANSIENGTIHLVPWARGYHDVLQHQHTMIYSAVRTPEREKLFAWVGPIGKLRMGLIAKKNKHLTLEVLRGQHPSKIGTVTDSGAEQALIARGFNANDLDRFSHIMSQLHKLKDDRLDAVAFNVDAMFQILKDMGCDINEYEIVEILKENDLYFAFNKQTDEKIIENLNQILKNIPR